MIDTKSPDFEAKIKEVLSDEAFIMSLFEMEDPELVKAAFADKDIEFTVEEIIGLRTYILKSQANDEEMSEDDMAEVAGGAGSWSDFDWMSALSTCCIWQGVNFNPICIDKLTAPSGNTRW